MSTNFLARILGFFVLVIDHDQDDPNVIVIANADCKRLKNYIQFVVM